MLIDRNNTTKDADFFFSEENIKNLNEGDILDIDIKSKVASKLLSLRGNIKILINSTNSLTSAQISKLKSYLITNNIEEVRQLLTSDMVQGFLTCSPAAVTNILFPLVYKYFNTSETNRSERDEVLKEMQNAYNLVCEIIDKDYDMSYVLASIKSVDIFERSVNLLISPHKIKINKH